MDGKKHILIVDDDDAIARGLTSLFTQAGYEVVMAHSGFQALAQLEPKPDLVILSP